jgi:hypothetical protein
VASKGQTAVTEVLEASKDTMTKTEEALQENWR